LISSTNEYANYIIKSLNLNNNQPVEIVSPIECKELVDILKNLLIVNERRVYVTFTNFINDYNVDRSIDFYEELMDLKFARITIVSSFAMPKSKGYIESQFPKLRSYFYNNQSQRVMCAYPNLTWSKRLGINYSELKKRIIDLSLKENKMLKYIDKLNDLPIKKLYITTSLGTNLKMELTKGFSFNSGIIKTVDGIDFLPNIPALEIFTSPIKDRVDGVIVGSKPVYINNHIISDFMIEFKDGEIINSKGIDSIITMDRSLNYVGEIGISIYNEMVFYNTLLDENTATHIALGNSYNMGILKSERGKINRSKYHIDLPFGNNDIMISFLDRNDNILAVFNNDEVIFNK